MQLESLRQLWEQTLGTPPMPEQFGLWSALHAEGVIRQAILRTARKNIDLNGIPSVEAVKRRALDYWTRSTGPKAVCGSCRK